MTPWTTSLVAVLLVASPAVADAQPNCEAISGSWLEPIPAYRFAHAGYLLFYRRRRGLGFGGSVPVIARYHAASDCASALSAARSDCAR